MTEESSDKEMSEEYKFKTGDVVDSISGYLAQGIVVAREQRKEELTYKVAWPILGTDTQDPWPEDSLVLSTALEDSQKYISELQQDSRKDKRKIEELEADLASRRTAGTEREAYDVGWLRSLGQCAVELKKAGFKKAAKYVGRQYQRELMVSALSGGSVKVVVTVYTVGDAVRFSLPGESVLFVGEIVSVNVEEKLPITVRVEGGETHEVDPDWIVEKVDLA